MLNDKYISLKSLCYAQPVVMSTLFDPVTIFADFFDITSADLYSLFLYDYGERLCAYHVTELDERDGFGDLAATVRNVFSTMYKTKLKHRYTELLATMDYEYNPLWNVDGTEVTETLHNQHKHENKDIDSTYNQKTKVETTHSQTQTVTTKNNQSQTVHTEQDRNYNYDEIQRPTKTNTETPETTITHKVAPYDMGDNESTTSTVDQSGGKTTKKEEYNGNEFLYQNRENDVTTSYNLQQGATADGDTVKTEYSGQPDTVETSHSGQPDHTDDYTETYYTGEADTVTLTRQGNIGVTSTQNLINQQRAVVDFDIVSRFLSEVADLLTLQVYSRSDL